LDNSLLTNTVGSRVV